MLAANKATEVLAAVVAESSPPAPAKQIIATLSSTMMKEKIVARSPGSVTSAVADMMRDSGTIIPLSPSMA